MKPSTVFILNLNPHFSPVECFFLVSPFPEQVFSGQGSQRDPCFIDNKSIWFHNPSIHVMESFWFHNLITCPKSFLSASFLFLILLHPRLRFIEWNPKERSRMMRKWAFFIYFTAKRDATDPIISVSTRGRWTFIRLHTWFIRYFCCTTMFHWHCHRIKYQKVWRWGAKEIYY